MGRFVRVSADDGAPRDAQQIGPEHVIAYLTCFANLSHETRHRYFREVRCFFHWLLAAGYCTEDPFHGLRNVRLPQRVVPPFTPADIAALLTHCAGGTPTGRRDRALVLLLLDTGIRCSEIRCSEAVRLDLADCDFAAGRCLIRHGRGNKQRVVPFAGRCGTALAAYCADRGTAPGPLFVAARYARLQPTVRLRPNGLKQILRRLGRASGIPKVHAHRFRHAFATWAIQHDARELDVQHLLGHASPDMVRRYAASYGAEQAASRYARFSPADQMVPADTSG